MAVRFIENMLVDDDGNIVQFSYKKLKQACLPEEFSTISIKNIIFEAVKNVTGHKVKGVDYRKSSLFNALENEILADENYQKEKARVREEAEKYKAEKPKVNFESHRAKYYTKVKMITESRRKQY